MIKAWSKLVTEMTAGLNEDASAAVVAGALALLMCLSSPTEQEARIALGFARDRVAAGG